MRFINKGKDIQVRIREKTGYRWKAARKNKIINLPEKIGLINGLDQLNVTEGKIGKTKVETKQVEYTNDSEFYKELLKIKGIGKFTAEDIVDWGTKEKLIEVVKLKGALPFRNDIEKILRKKYG